MTVDVVLSVYNAMPYLPELIDSLRAQTHADWRLWVRDDGSSDRSVEVIQEFEARDARIHLLSHGGERLRASRSYGWLLQRPEVDAEYVMLCDADDYWLPEKIEVSVAAMRAAEGEGSPDQPVLVHTDLRVADSDLQIVAPSFWSFRGLSVNRADLRRLVYENVVTGPTVTMNRALRELAVPIPAEAPYQDWWVALVAAAFGRIVALRTPTVLYRQHGRNSVGASQRRGLGELVRKMGAGAAARAQSRGELDRAAQQAAAFLRRYGDALTEPHRRMLRRFAGIPSSGPVRRRWSMLRLARSPDESSLRALGRAIRG